MAERQERLTIETCNQTDSELLVPLAIPGFEEFYPLLCRFWT